MVAAAPDLQKGGPIGVTEDAGRVGEPADTVERPASGDAAR